MAKAADKESCINKQRQLGLDLPPDGRAALKTARPTGSMAGFVGLLAGQTTKVASIEEISDAAALGWADHNCQGKVVVARNSDE